jgi:cell division septum initiation protein DivIVA
MMPEDLREQIAGLEDRIEALARTADSCRKMIVAAKLAIAAGTAWWLLLPFGIVTFSPTAMTVALAAILGGIVLLGSNTSTLRQAVEDTRKAEALRNELIGRSELKTVDEGDGDYTIVPWQTPRLH